MEQYTRKNSLEIHGVPESAYSTTEEIVLKLAEVLEVSISPQEISRKLKRKGNKPITVKFANHKIKRNIYKSRAKLKTSKYPIYFLAPPLLHVQRETVSSARKLHVLQEENSKPCERNEKRWSFAECLDPRLQNLLEDFTRR